MSTMFNDLLESVGIPPREVRLLRHHDKKPGLGGRSLHDLWVSDRAGFERYQSTQEKGRTLFLTSKYWASFVVPTPGSALFVGLYEVNHADTRAVEWSCPYRGGKPGGGALVDVFTTVLRPELSALIGKAQVVWDPASVRTWARYAETAKFPLVAADVQGAVLGGEALVEALQKLGFEASVSKTMTCLVRGDLAVYVQGQQSAEPLIVHRRFLDLASELQTLGVGFGHPACPYVDEALLEFPRFANDGAPPDDRFGFALAPSRENLAALVELLETRAVLQTYDGPIRLVGTITHPLTTRERLVASRMGQGDFRSALIAAWGGECPVAGVDHLDLLRASHIKPWSASSDQERLDPFNGLLLCAHIDALFDRGFISFAQDGRMLVSASLSAENRQRLGISGGDVIRLDDRHLSYLDYHRRHVFSG